MPLPGPDIDGLAHLSVFELSRQGFEEPFAPPSWPRRPLEPSSDVVLLSSVRNPGAWAPVRLGMIDPLEGGGHANPATQPCTNHPVLFKGSS